MMDPKTIVAATRNPGKIREMRLLLAGLPVRLVGLDEFPRAGEIAETGATFIENAELKAMGYARVTGAFAVSDDSGLVVDALGGAPGVHSARFAGDGATDNERIGKLLREIGDAADRSARFVCAISVADETGRILRTVEGRCEGRIAFTPTGTNGFGYDPIFVPEGFSESFGELPDAVKSQISHRADATRQILRFFADFWGNRT